MISEQLSKYKKSSNTYQQSERKLGDKYQPPSYPQSSVYSQLSYNPSYHLSQSSSRQQTPKSKIAQLNQKLMKQAELYSERRSQQVHYSHVRSQSRSRYQKPFNPLDPIITRFAQKQDRIRKKNAVTKYKLTSGINKQLSKQKIKLALPPKSPFVVSEYLQSSARSYGEKEGHKSTAHSYGKKGVEQIVFVTDQSGQDNDRNSEDEYQSVQNKNVSKNQNKVNNYNQTHNQQLKITNNGFGNYSGIRTGSGFRTPSFNEQYHQPILSPLEIQKQLNKESNPYCPTAPSHLEYTKFQQQPHYESKESTKLANKKPIYLSAFIVTLIAIFLIYEIIK